MWSCGEPPPAINDDNNYCDYFLEVKQKTDKENIFLINDIFRLFSIERQRICYKLCLFTFLLDYIDELFGI